MQYQSWNVCNTTCVPWKVNTQYRKMHTRSYWKSLYLVGTYNWCMGPTTKLKCPPNSYLLQGLVSSRHFPPNLSAHQRPKLAFPSIISATKIKWSTVPKCRSLTAFLLLVKQGQGGWERYVHCCWPFWKCSCTGLFCVPDSVWKGFLIGSLFVLNRLRFRGAQELLASWNKISADFHRNYGDTRWADFDDDGKNDDEKDGDKNFRIPVVIQFWWHFYIYSDDKLRLPEYVLCGSCVAPQDLGWEEAKLHLPNLIHHMWRIKWWGTTVVLIKSRKTFASNRMLKCLQGQLFSENMH